MRIYIYRDFKVTELPPISIIVVAWNGLHLLKNSLPLINDALAYYPAKGEIIIYDNGSHDDTKEWIKNHYPDIKIFFSPTNLGFSKANNIAASHARFSYLLFLNDYISPQKDFIQPLIEPLNNSDIFIVFPWSIKWCVYSTNNSQELFYK